MQTLIPLFILMSVALTGCGSDMNRKYVIKDEPGMITLASFEPVLMAQDNEPIAFEDRSLEDRRRLQALTNRAVVEKETSTYVKTGQADKILLPDNTVLFPYGLSQPKLVCAKMLYCKIILQEGEEVIDMSAGDTLRWQTKVSYRGTAESFTPIIQIKPFNGGLTTNLSIITDQHDYDIIITSIEEGEYMPRIGFYYPQEAANKGQGLPQPPKPAAINQGLPAIDMENIHFVYAIEGEKSLAWYPSTVFDDGHKVFIKMSDRVKNSELPVFLAVNDKGQKEVVNYRYKKPYIIVDTLFSRGELILGGEKSQKTIVIRKKG